MKTMAEQIKPKFLIIPADFLDIKAIIPKIKEAKQLHAPHLNLRDALKKTYSYAYIFEADKKKVRGFISLDFQNKNFCHVNILFARNAGGALLKWAEKEAYLKGKLYIRLGTTTSAISFYKHMGYKFCANPSMPPKKENRALLGGCGGMRMTKLVRPLIEL